MIHNKLQLNGDKTEVMLATPKKFHNHPPLPPSMQTNQVDISFFHLFAPQWGAADAEIKVPSGENTELKRSPFKVWSRSVYSRTCDAYLSLIHISEPTRQ